MLLRGNSQFAGRVPQGLKPAFFQALNGTVETVPCPKPVLTRYSVARLYPL